METINSISGGKTSAFMAVHYPTDYNVFALVRTEDMDCQYPDAKIRFLSCEPLWAPVDLTKYISPCSIFCDHSQDDNWYEGHKPNIPQIDWVIVGGESGNETGKYRYRPCELQWLESIVEQCQEVNVPIFVKQMGTYLGKQLKLTDRHGGNISEFPKQLQVREFPNA